MPVLFIIDPFAIGTEEAVIAEESPQAIEQLRLSITQHLNNEDPSILRIRFINKALFKYFRYFEGLQGVLITQSLIPRSVYRDYVQVALPDWLTDKLIIQLDLLKSAKVMHNEPDLLDHIIVSCHPDLFNKSFIVFSQALITQSDVFWKLMVVPAIQARFMLYWQRDFNFSKELAQLFMERLIKAQSVAGFFTVLAYEQHQERLRKHFAQLHLKIPLAARSLPPLLLNTPLLPLAEPEAKDLPEKCLSALDTLCRHIEQEKAKASDIERVVIAAWSSVLQELDTRLKQDARLISDELINQLKRLENQEANLLARALTERLVLATLAPLMDDVPVQEVLNWSQEYFDFVKQSFLSNQVVDNSLNLSFSEWLLKQSARVARSDSDWRQFSKRVEQYLKQEYLVVICIVDALSALNQDLLLESAKGVEHLTLMNEILFAPLPTLTEVGKMAVITGKETHELPSDPKKAIRQQYRDYLPEDESLMFVKSWEFASERITKKTNLVVFLENRIDERLHECVDFEKHRKDVTPVLKQMMHSIDSWKKDAGHFNRDVVFLITADHGMTVTQEDYQGAELGEPKERVFKVPLSYKKEQSEFALIKNGEKQAYLMPKKRVRLFDKALLTHGGLTPEEVLIPFVTLSSRQAEAIKTPLELTLLSDACQRINERSWQISVELSAQVAVQNITLKLVAPLIGEESIVGIAANGSQRLLLSFTSANEQTGMIELIVQLDYDREGAHERNTKSFSCEFPEPLIRKDAATQGFEGMF